MYLASLQEYYKGFLSTQPLNLDDKFSFTYQLPENCKPTSISDIKPNQRLGHFAEELFIDLLKSTLFQKEQLLSNIQIIDDKITLGELDIISVGEKITHIEFCYKIYLLDPTLSDNEFDCWIGPNRRDSLAQKVDKLKTKQLPLFYEKQTTTLLKKQIKDFDQFEKKQAVAFMAQLYVPYTDFIAQTTYQYGYPDGFYIHFNELERFKEAQWFVPGSKLDWMLSPTSKVDWMDQEDLAIVLQKHYSKDSNPLCWMKSANEELIKCFVVNW